MPRKYTPEERLASFWAKVNKTDSCWLWTASLNEYGYGKFTVRDDGHKRCIRAHRYSWTLTYGPILDDKWVLHDCDVKNCVRPDHLHLGDRPANVAEAIQRERIASGERHWSQAQRRSVAVGERNGHALLTTEIVLNARRRYAAGGILQRELAAEYGVTREAMRNAINGKNWKHLT